MARASRLVIPGQTMHIVQRGCNDDAVFFNKQDYERYLRLLRIAAETHSVAVHAYVLMPNHVHQLVTPTNEAGPARMVQSITRQYARYVHKEYDRSGALWESRYQSALIGPGRYLFDCSRYIELNPVRNRLVKAPAQYRWSSYHTNARGASDLLVTRHAAYLALASTQRERVEAYQCQFHDALEQATVDRIRAATKRGAVFGDAQFRFQVKAMMGDGVERDDRHREPNRDDLRRWKPGAETDVCE